MKYLPTVPLVPAIERALVAGALRLQPGQWIRPAGYGPADPPSRFSHVSPAGVIHAAHGRDASRKFITWRTRAKVRRAANWLTGGRS